VTDIARSMVTRYGMSERLGSVAYDRDSRSFLGGPNLPLAQREQDYADETAAAIDAEVRGIVQHAMDRALAILRQKRDILERSARRLLEKETLDEKDLMEILGPPPGPARMAAE
jgi:cell division protease FtsH